MTLGDIDPVLTPPKRLAAMGIVATVKEVEFSFVRDHLDLSDSDLSKQMRALADAGYVVAVKHGRGRRRSTWFSITEDGRRAVMAHVAALNALVDQAPAPTEATPDNQRAP